MELETERLFLKIIDFIAIKIIENDPKNYILLFL